MKVIFEKSELLTALIPAAGVVPGHNTAAATDGILFECPGDDPGTCRISAYDMEKGVRTSINAKIMDEGKFILNTQKILQIVRALPDGNIEIDIDADFKAKISSGSSSFEIMGIDGADFPGLPLLSGDRNYTLTGTKIRSIISKTMIYANPNDTRPAFTGVFFKIENGVMTVVGCDGNRMAICEEELGDGVPDARMLIPVKILSEILKVIKDTDDEVTISLARKHVIFNIDGVLYFTRLIDTEYLDYYRILPKSFETEVFIISNDLRSALDRASIITEGKLGGNTKTYVRFDVVDGCIKISSSSTSGSIYEEIPSSKNGNDITIGFNCKYILDALRACPEAYSLRIRMNNPTAGICIEEVRGSGIIREVSDSVVPEGFDRADSDGEDKMKFIYFVMPKRITGN